MTEDLTHFRFHKTIIAAVNRYWFSKRGVLYGLRKNKSEDNSLDNYNILKEALKGTAHEIKPPDQTA